MEANGIAALVLHLFGTHGAGPFYGRVAFAIYKFVMVVFIIVICEVVATRSVPKARIVMLLGCTVYAGIVLYESYLIYENITLPTAIHGAAAGFITLTGWHLFGLH